MNKTVKISAAVAFLLIVAVAPALGIQPPVITLDRVEVASIQPFYMRQTVIGKNDDGSPKMGAVGYSSTLSLAYVFNIKNPNKEPLMLDEIQFTTAFEGFDVSTAIAYEDAWVPGEKTNQLRVVVVTEAHPTVMSLMVGAGNAERVKSMKTNAKALVEKWFAEIADFKFPIEVKGGTAIFQDEKGKEVRATFKDTWPKN